MVITAVQTEILLFTNCVMDTIVRLFVLLTDLRTQFLFSRMMCVFVYHCKGNAVQW